ncbi:amino acid adenylation domain-containing protein [Thiorhodovibrio litoralis]|uniref:amino acid adenylation domain-containing protein n=1 Tax=Thiorhodovibrio litoralis TaxID=2952932 RepID=UPI002B258952|nr:amino acid adenylation domain-containing protein [Thiorhodovibrio litoralis]WPL14180.1 Tyrocidine synthase III [Thiorhodovibrio litoralis]
MNWLNLGLAFADIAARHPQRIALRWPEGATLTYAELDDLTGHLAAWLHERGIGLGASLAILNDKSPTAYALMLACLRLGVLYSNLDPGSPPARLQRMLATLRPALLAHASSHAPIIAALRDLAALPPTLDYSASGFAAAHHPLKPRPADHQVPGHAPAYLMFTSGSTGIPKGVVIAQHSALNFIRWCQQEMAIGPDEVLTGINPLHFDNAVFDVHAALFAGATLAPMPDALAKNPRHLIKAVAAARCTLWFSVPSLLVYLLRLRALEPGDLPDLRRLLFGGEGFPKPALRDLHALLGEHTQFINAYGPTEGTCICSSHPVQPADLDGETLLPLGPLTPNFSGLIVDDQLKPLPAGEVGELLLGGPQIALGYYRDPQRTAAAFIQNPTHQDYRDLLYRTGDRVRQDPMSGLLHFVGRADRQIKRMGYRIELDEIEAALVALPGVREAAVVAVPDPSGASPSILAALCTDQTEADLRAQLAERLPAYMLPGRYAFHDRLPRNRNGKIERLALMEREPQRNGNRNP